MPHTVYRSSFPHGQAPYQQHPRERHGLYPAVFASQYAVADEPTATARMLYCSSPSSVFRSRYGTTYNAKKKRSSSGAF